MVLQAFCRVCSNANDTVPQALGVGGSKEGEAGVVVAEAAGATPVAATTAIRWEGAYFTNSSFY